MTTLLSRGLVERALRDGSFKSSFPEFNSISVSKAVTGCRNCANKKQVVAPNVQLSVFMRIVESLSSTKLSALKKYFNADSIQYRLNNEVRTL
jgi:hypothetical protein